MFPPTLDARVTDDKFQKVYLLNLKIQDTSRNLAKHDLGKPHLKKLYCYYSVFSAQINQMIFCHNSIFPTYFVERYFC